MTNQFDDFNDISPIVTLQYAEHIFVFTGDAGYKTERQFINSIDAADFDFSGATVYLKIGHHGSNSSSYGDFLALIQPDKAVICLGARNVYGFPHRLVLARLSQAGLEGQDIWRTSELGNIAVVVDERGERVYFAFDNQADLRALWVLALVSVFVLCFVNFGWKV